MKWPISRVSAWYSSWKARRQPSSSRRMGLRNCRPGSRSWRCSTKLAPSWWTPSSSSNSARYSWVQQASESTNSSSSSTSRTSSNAFRSWWTYSTPSQAIGRCYCSRWFSPSFWVRYRLLLGSFTSLRLGISRIVETQAIDLLIIWKISWLGWCRM